MNRFPRKLPMPFMHLPWLERWLLCVNFGEVGYPYLKEIRSQPTERSFPQIQLTIGISKTHSACQRTSVTSYRSNDSDSNRKRMRTFKRSLAQRKKRLQLFSRAHWSTAHSSTCFSIYYDLKNHLLCGKIEGQATL